MCNPQLIRIGAALQPALIGKAEGICRAKTEISQIFFIHCAVQHG
jgi:hypothetical protein